MVAIFLIALMTQGLLAMFVYRDAHARGDDEGVWAVITLLLGVIGTLMYILNRPDEKVPREDRELSSSTKGLKVVGLYLIAAGFGAVVSILIAIILSRGLALPQERIVEINNLVLLGLMALFPALLHLYRYQEVVKESLPV